MTNEEKLKQAYDDVIWMAIRYASGRSTYAPSLVRDSIKQFQSVFPDWKPRKDYTVADDRKRIEEHGTEHSNITLESDWLDDLV